MKASNVIPVLASVKALVAWAEAESAIARGRRAASENFMMKLVRLVEEKKS